MRSNTSALTLPYPPDASTYYAAIADLPWSVWLDSGGRGRFDILLAEPICTLVTQGADTCITDENGSTHSTADAFDLLRAQLGTPLANETGLPFIGGAVGYWGYDLSRSAASPHTPDALPDMAVGIYDWAVVIDHQARTAQLVSPLRYPQTAQALPRILARLQDLTPPSRPPFQVHGSVRSNFTRADYQAAFEQVQAYLQAGDCYQINLAQRFSAQASGDAFSAYLALRQLSPAPYSAFLNLPHSQILCASPERFLRVREGRVETKPIKGTRPRLPDSAADARIAEELRHSPKDRAENLMIVDLLRNDLGKNCVAGSVRVPKLFDVESYATVHHLVSTVLGELAAGRDALHLLRDCFPGGSITGAPKQRAIDIIAQLEPHPRGIYCGAIGYLGFDGNMDSNLAIRTLVYAAGEIHAWAGGGIVADSTADAEYQETLDKAAAMLAVMQQFGGVR